MCCMMVSARDIHRNHFYSTESTTEADILLVNIIMATARVTYIALGWSEATGNKISCYLVITH